MYAGITADFLVMHNNEESCTLPAKIMHKILTLVAPDTISMDDAASCTICTLASSCCLGCLYLLPEAVWVAPSIRNSGTSTRRIASFVDKSKRLMIRGKLDHQLQGHTM